jgi:hypothetical protein
VTSNELEKLRRFRRQCAIAGPIFVGAAMWLPVERLLLSCLPMKVYQAIGDLPAGVFLVGLLLSLLAWKLPVPEEVPTYFVPKQLPRVIDATPSP